MNTLFIQCNMGAAGDMLTAALLELVSDPEQFLSAMNAAGIPGMHMVRQEKVSCGLKGSHISVSIYGEEEISDDVREAREPAHGHEHHHLHGESGEGAADAVRHVHADLAGVRELIDSLNLPDQVKVDAAGVYALIADAEAHAHGCEVAHVHFHELGMLDAVTDVCAVCLLMYLLKPDRVVVSPICTGFGEVRCMHGIVPVPAPATAYLLRDMPAYGGRIRAELLTPTGAALLKYFAHEFGQMPAMQVKGVGCGMGTKEFEVANCIRAFWGTEFQKADGEEREAVVELCCNLDDMTGEAIAFAMEKLMSEGALDVYSTPIQMKKGRPGICLSCLCHPQDTCRMEDLMLQHTTTLGVRRAVMDRRIVSRKSRYVSTPYGQISMKFAECGDVVRYKPEYEDAARAARENRVSLLEVLDAARRAVKE